MPARLKDFGEETQTGLVPVRETIKNSWKFFCVAWSGAAGIRRCGLGRCRAGREKALCTCSEQCFPPLKQTSRATYCHGRKGRPVWSRGHLLRACIKFGRKFFCGTLVLRLCYTQHSACFVYRFFPWMSKNGPQPGLQLQ